jgi:protein AATF/BFR2
LRKPSEVALGPQYAGSKVRRDAIEEDDEDDPFSRGFSEDESEDDEQSSGVKLVNGGNGDEDMVNGFHHSSGENNEENDEGTDSTDDEEEDEVEKEVFSRKQTADGIIDRSELRKLMADDQKSVAATLSQSAKADAVKGKAVKAQRATFDTLLNSRIKLQRGLVATNSLLAVNAEADTSQSEDVIEAAEAAAIQLWNNLTSLRANLQASKMSQKRSHKQFTREDSLDAFWDETKSYEAAQKKTRTTVLDFWASKTRATTSLPQARGRLQQPVKEQQLSDVLAGQMVDMSRLVAKTQVPRSCAPLQAAFASKRTNVMANGVHHSDDNSPTHIPIYDDADFYTTLLASLISQRSTDATVNLQNLSIQPWQAAREAKAKKVVDTKASKGRKLRYTVHEKLVSFMASEDRGSWGERQADELFGSLFGQRMGLGEDEGEEMEEDLEVEGLRLFGDN